MANKYFWFRILVMILVFGMTVVGCDNTTNNLFEGTSWYLYNQARDNHSTLDFESSTWTWFDNLMPNSNDELTNYYFKGTYTYKENIATMISTHYRLSQGHWVSWSGKWTATITGNNKSVHYDGDGNPRIMPKEQIGDFSGYRNIK